MAGVASVADGTDYSWIGPALGAAAGYFGSQGSNSTTTTNQLPAQFQPLAAGVAQRGIDIGNMPYTPYGGQRVAGFTPFQFAGMDQIANQAMGPNTTLRNADSFLGGLLGGPGQNAQADAVMQQAQDDVMGRLNSSAFSSGSFGNAGVAEAGARGLGKAMNDVRMQALSQVPSISAAQYMPGQQLMGIGGLMQQQGQNQLDANYQQFQDWQNWPFKTYDAMMAPFGRNLGSSTTQTGPGGNVAAGMLGGAMLGSRLQQGWGSRSSGGGGWGTGNAWGNQDLGQYY